MGSIIIVSYWYAPNPAVGAKRFSFLAREFTRLGYDVHVVTHQSREWIDWKTDSTLPLAGTVHRCAESLKLPLPANSAWRRGINAIMRRVLAPVGWEALWAGAAARQGLEAARHLASPGVVIATSPAHSALLAGERIARRLGWPLILDYRDPWSAHDWPRWRRSALSRWFSRRIEARLVRRSAARVLNTPAMRASFEACFRHSDRARNHVIPNGFDAAAPPPPAPSSGPVEILHAGEIFQGRSLLPVLRAAASLRPRFPARPVRVTTCGDLPANELARIREERLDEFLEVQPRVPFAELFQKLQRAHLLLAVVGEHMLYSTPYKVYDYMAAGRPILGIAPRGAALFDLLADSGAGRCVAPEDAPGIEEALSQYLRGEWAEAPARVERFRWENLAIQYRQVIEAVRASTPAAALSAKSEAPT
jgi:glycosyltransferase involved in cell wall biosynthesis